MIQSSILILILFINNLYDCECSFAGLWGLVNNAGITRDKIIPIEYHTRDDFKEVLDINLLGMIDMCTTFFPLLKATKGRIVNMTSVAGRISTPYSFEYCASKHGAESFSDGLR